MMYLSKSNARALYRLYEKKCFLDSLADLAKESGVPLQDIQAYFNAEREKIELEHVAGLAEVFGMTVAELDLFLLDHY
ncbi:helix-turn-helix transcriptional regulator [Christensenellaceae bacterium OttesenSCG-928-K19]|nr:helix-turn-helix transcriptional regulator [Christensenellaceae bacterium OttesenSCG-928-K19]